MKAKILLIEDDARTQSLVCKILEKEGYRAKAAEHLRRAQEELARFAPDLLILDRKLPDGDGLEFCRRLRSDPKTKALPILFLTSRDTLLDKVDGLKTGGDDYLTKPFQTEELLARIEVLLRRVKVGSGPSAGLRGQSAAWGILLDLERHVCSVDGRPVKLWPKEFELLQVFLERPGRLLSKEFLSERVWGHEFFPTSRAVEIAVQRLRHKLGPNGRRLETVKGYGFKLQEDN